MDDLDQGKTLTGLRVGQIVFQRFSLRRLLGRGGMGVVWLAQDERLGREIALKFLPESVAADARALDDLRRETRRSLELTHVGIIRIHDLHEQEQLGAIAMEFVDGRTLSQLTLEKPQRCFEVAEITPWVKQLCDALTYAHDEAKIVHRDLKPANLMLDARNRLKIADFGISGSVADSVSRVSNVVGGTSGTPVYMSPQQMMGEKPAVTDDVYSLGATLYELLTGKPPFYSGRIEMQVMQKLPPSIAERRVELGINGEPIPPAWEQTILACLAKDPADRPQSTAAVTERLGLSINASAQRPSADKAGLVAFIRSEAKQAVHKSLGESQSIGLGTNRSSNKTPLYAAVAAVVVLLGLAGWYFGLHLPEQKRLVEIARFEQAGQEINAAKLRTTREQSEALAKAQIERERAQTEQENREFEAVSARIASLLDNAPPGQIEILGQVMQKYLARAPMRHRTVAEAAWQSRVAGWESARLAAARGGIAVRTMPTGAEVRIGALAVDRSPVNLKDQKLGTYPVRIRQEGYENWDGEVEVKENEFAELNVTLVRSTGTLVLASEPAGIEAEIRGRRGQDGDRKAKTPVELKLPTGAYDLTFRRSGWPDQMHTVEISRNESAMASAEFVPGTLQVTSEPTGAEVMADGKRLGMTPLTLTDAVPGDYRLGLQTKGRKPAVSNVTVLSRKTVAVNLSLAPWIVVGEKFTIPDLDLELMPVAPGTFQMGSTSGGSDDERPVTSVTLTQSFWLGKTEVTQAQWQTLMGSNPSHFQGDSLPVEQVTWKDAMDFCRRLTERERLAGRLPEDYTYTLPTEAQWEYACRAGTTWDYAGNIDAMAWYDSTSNNQPRPVGTKHANAWGLYDMHGNVWEWCLDWYGKYTGGSVHDSTGSDWGLARVYRGGSWNGSASGCRSAFRLRGQPGDRWYGLGFRLALSSVK